MKSLLHTSLTFLCLFLFNVILLSQTTLHLKRPGTRNEKIIPIGTLLEVFQKEDVETKTPPYLYFGSLLRVDKDSLQLALLDIPKVKYSKFHSVYSNSELYNQSIYHSIALNSIEKIKRTSDYKRSVGAAIVRGITGAGIVSSSLLMVGGIALTADHPEIAGAVILSSAILLSLNVTFFLVSKPKKYKISPALNKDWIIIR